MSQPQERGAGVAEKEEVHLPREPDALRIKGSKAIPVKRDVPGFISEDQTAHVGDGLVAAVPSNHPVVTRADDLDDEQDQHFKLGIEDAATLVEKAEGIAVLNQRSSQTGDGTVEQTAVFFLLGKPEINDFSHAVIGGTQCFGIGRNETAGSSAITELILRERGSECSSLLVVHSKRSRP